MTKKQPKEVKRQKITIEVVTYDDGKQKRSLDLNDIGHFELLGIIEGLRAEMRLSHLNMWMPRKRAEQKGESDD